MKPLISVKKLQNTFCISFLLFGLFATESNSQVAFTKFENTSSYEGIWELEYDFPNFISGYLRERFEIQVLSPKLMEDELSNSHIQNFSLHEMLRNLGYKYLISGKVTKFSISRFTAGEPKLAGYETYSNDIAFTISILDLNSQQTIYADAFSNELSDLGVGITIFGRESESKKEFYSLDKMKFGSAEFAHTLIGKNMLALCEKFAEHSKAHFSELKINDVNLIKDDPNPSPSPFIKKIVRGEILLIDYETKEVFINLGSSDNLSSGAILSIYSVGDSLFDPSTEQFLGVSDKKVGEVEIVEVRGERFSLGVIRGEEKDIKKGLEVRKIAILPR